MQDTIFVAEAVKDKAPVELTSLLEGTYTLTKIGSKRESKVGVGQCETGTASVCSVQGDPAMIVQRGFHYLRTSPIVKITENTETTVTFETEGGIYKLERNDQ